MKPLALCSTKKSPRQFAAETLRLVIPTVSGIRNRGLRLQSPAREKDRGSPRYPSGGQQLPPWECLSLPAGGAMLQPKAQVLNLAKETPKGRGLPEQACRLA